MCKVASKNYFLVFGGFHTIFKLKNQICFWELSMSNLGVLILFFCYTWCSSMFSRDNAKIIYVSKAFDSFLAKFSSFLKCGTPCLL
jgi:hypothetical protein